MSKVADVAEARQDRYGNGLEVFDRVVGEGGRALIDQLADVSPELGHQVVSWLFGEIYPRPGLAPRDRQLVTLGVLTALGGAETEVEVQTKAALNVGLTPEEIVEALLHSMAYCGVPRAINATLAAKKALGERGLLPVTTDRPAGKS